jgi:hypothetical protein
VLRWPGLKVEPLTPYHKTLNYRLRFHQLFQSHQIQSTVFFVESSDGTKTATVTLDSHADVQKLYKLRKGSLKLKDEVLTLDRNFLRFTVLHEERDPKVE